MRYLYLLIVLSNIGLSFAQEKGAYDSELVKVSQQHLPIEKEDSLIYSFDDYYKNHSYAERELFEKTLVNKLFYLDQKSEIQNMIELFGKDFYKEIPSYSFSEKLDTYISSSVPNYSKGIEFWKSKLDTLNQVLNAKNTDPYITNQLWNNSNYMLELNGKALRYNFDNSSTYYIPSISSYEIHVDTNNVYSLYPTQEDIFSEIMEISDPVSRYTSHVLFLYNLYGDNLYPTIFQLAPKISDDLSDDLSISEEFKADMLLAISKILAATREETMSWCILKNYGRLYGLLEHKDRNKYNIVKSMEVQLMNYMSMVFPRKNQFNSESYRCLKELVNDQVKGHVNIDFNVSLCEILIQQMFGRSDRDFDFSSQDSTYFLFIAQWRIVNTLYEISTAENNNIPIPRYIYDRMFAVTSRYYWFLGRQKSIVNNILQELNLFRCSPENLDVNIRFVPDILWVYDDPKNAMKWKKHIGEFTNVQPEIDEEFGFMKRINKPFKQLSEKDKAAFLSTDFDTIISIYEQFLELKPSELIGHFENLPNVGNEFLLISSYLAKNESYKGAYVFERIGSILNNHELDLSVYSNVTLQRNQAKSSLVLRNLEFQKLQLESRNDWIEQQLFQREKELEKINLELSSKNALLIDKEIEAAYLDSQIIRQDSILKLTKQETILSQKKLDSIQGDYLEIERLNIELENSNQELSSAVRARNIVLLFLVLTLGAVFFFERRSRYQATIAKNQALLLQKEKDTSEALRRSIGQVGHLCRSGISNILTTYLRFSEDKNAKKAKSSFTFLSNTFEMFRSNRNVLLNRIEDEVTFAVRVEFFQHPEFCEGKTEDDILNMISYTENVGNTLVPIYTVANVVRNFFQHSVLSDNNKMIISIEDLPESTKISLDCDAKPRQGKGTGDGMNYIEFMIKSVFGGENVLSHYPKQKTGYKTILNLKKK